MGEREDGARNRRVVTLVLLGGGAGLFAGGLHLAASGPPRILRVPGMRVAGGITRTPPPGGWQAVVAIQTHVPALEVGETFQLLVTSYDGRSTTADVTPDARFMVLADGDVAHVTTHGLVRAVAPGEATLVVTYPDPDTGVNHSQSLMFSVSPQGALARAPLTKLELHCASRELAVGDVVQLAVRDVSGLDVTARVTLAITPPDAGRIDADRRLHVHAPLAFTITATLDDPPLSARGTYAADRDATCPTTPPIVPGGP